MHSPAWMILWRESPIVNETLGILFSLHPELLAGLAVLALASCFDLLDLGLGAKELMHDLNDASENGSTLDTGSSSYVDTSWGEGFNPAGAFSVNFWVMHPEAVFQGG